MSRGVDVTDFQAHVIDHVEGAKARSIAGTKITINIGEIETGVKQGAAGRFRVQLRHRLVGRLAGGVLEGTHNESFVFDRHLGRSSFRRS